MDASDALKEYIETKAAKLPRIFDRLQMVDVTLDIDGGKPMMEIVATATRKHTFFAKHRDEDMYACVDQCIDKIQEQIRRFKDKVRDRQGPSHSELT
jgi:putative sigma-54 modulation protein